MRRRAQTWVVGTGETYVEGSTCGRCETACANQCKSSCIDVRMVAVYAHTCMCQPVAMLLTTNGHCGEPTCTMFSTYVYAEARKNARLHASPTGWFSCVINESGLHDVRVHCTGESSIRASMKNCKPTDARWLKGERARLGKQKFATRPGRKKSFCGGGRM